LLKKKYIFIGIGALIVIFVILRPDLPLGWYKDLKQKFETEDLSLKRQIDSIQEVRKTELESLNLDAEIMVVSKELEIARQRIKIYDKELSDYRNAGFDERFRRFTELVTQKDTISGQ